MNLKVDREELPEIVEEVARLEEADQALLETGEAKQILRELALPETRIDEARLVIAQKREEKRAQQKRRVIAVAGALLLLAGASALVLRSRAEDHALAQMSAAQAVVELAGAPAPAAVARASSPELRFAVVLASPPQGAALPLRCEWAGPDGAVRYTNRWDTKSIDRDRFPTHCRHAFGAADAAGTWSVTMKQGERTVATQSFVLE
jgi:hypothetical protein